MINDMNTTTRRHTHTTMTDAAKKKQKKTKNKKLKFFFRIVKRIFRFAKLSGLVKKTKTHTRKRLYKEKELDPAVSEANERDDLIDRDKPLSPNV